MHPSLKGKRLIRIVLAIVFLIFAAPRLLIALAPSDTRSITDDGLISYPKNRGAVESAQTVLNETPEFTLSKIIYVSKGEKIYALLRVPKTSEKRKPALILLPGAQVTKEGMRDRAEKFAEFGYVTLTIDERGNTGETGGGASLDSDYASFAQGVEPARHKMVFDVLRAFDFLREQEYIDAKNIAVFGESMGGRYAIIAGAVEPRIKAVVGISTSGYGSVGRQFPDETAARFFKSIDPDAYIGKISPRSVLMVHSANDAIIPIESAEATFSYAKEPKKFITADYRTHGWHTDMAPLMQEELRDIFQSR